MPEYNKNSSRFLDQQFAVWVASNFCASSTAADRDCLKRIAEAVSHATYLKHSCLDIEKYKNLQDPVLNGLLKNITPEIIKKVIAIVDSADDKNQPLVCSVDGKRAWLNKYYGFEQGVAQELLKLKKENRIEIITGGPGTGKTWTAAQRIREKLIENPDCKIALAAPTGKAANNMVYALEKSGLSPNQHQIKGSTLHSLLGINDSNPHPRRSKNNPVACDFLVIDEASMIDLPMMHRVLQALPVHAQLLLLGDKDQLASVEAGSVLHEICDVSDFEKVITTLQESRRYQDSPEIGVLATALNRGSVPEMSANKKVLRHHLPVANPWNPPWLDPVVQQFKQWHKTLENIDASTALAQQKQFQILCALREGPQGVKGINALIEKALHHKADSWYIGKPVMITVNNHERKLYNGDVGIVLSVDGVLKACFQIDGQLKMISPVHMPPYEICYAITVHKSQGSEYNRVLVVLPADDAEAHSNPVLTRELVYTAVTRAKDRIDLWCGKGVLEAAAAKTLQRMSGLGVLMKEMPV